jgi:hypothetical protein
VSETSFIRTPRTANVKEDWAASLPEETARVFDAMCKELQISYAILSVTLDDALSLCPQGMLAPAPQHAVVFADLFDRLACQLRVVLRAIEDHGRYCGTLPNVASLRPEHFRSQRAQQVARTNLFLSRLVFRGRTLFFHKLGALREVIAGLQRQTRNVVDEIALGNSLDAPAHWNRLEILHYDLNTCLQETTVVLKSFFCVLPGNELPLFRNRLLA